MESSSWLLLHENVILKNIVFSSSSYTHLLCDGPITSHLIQGFWVLADFFKVPTLAMLSAEKEWGCISFLFFFFSGYFWNWYFSFCLSPSFPAFSMMCFFFPFFAFFLPFLIFPNPALKSLTLKTKQNKTRKRAIHKPSANTLTDAAYKPSCEVKQTCNVSHQKLSLSLSVWVPTL